MGERERKVQYTRCLSFRILISSSVVLRFLYFRSQEYYVNIINVIHTLIFVQINWNSLFQGYGFFEANSWIKLSFFQCLYKCVSVFLSNCIMNQLSSMFVVLLFIICSDFFLTFKSALLSKNEAFINVLFDKF